MRRLSQERIDLSQIQIHNESSKLPGHEKRIAAHCKRVQSEYFDLRAKDGRFVQIAKLAKSIELMDSI